MKHATGKAIAWIDHYLADPRLSPETQLRKRWAWIWLLTTLVGVIATHIQFLFMLKLWPLIWMGIFFLTGYIFAFSLYRRVFRFDLVLNIVFAAFTLAAFFGMIQVGGLSKSLGMVFIGINCAMGSVLAGNIRWSVGLFILYCLTIIALGILNPYLQTPEYITPEVNNRAFVFLAVWVNACILFLVVLFMMDKSRYEKAEAEKLRKLDEAKTLLYTNVSHEFRTPLTIIRGIAEKIKEQSGKQYKVDVEKIINQSDILLRLVKQMLDISKIEAESMGLEEIHGNIAAYVKFIIAQFESLAVKKNITLITQVSKNPLYTDYDPEKLREILSNLLSNAIKFTPAQGEIKVTVVQKKNREQEMIMITVADTGIGIHPEEILHIFDRFYQAKVDHHTPGTGLGMAITRELVALMNGEITVKSDPGKGTVFTILIPFKEMAEKTVDDGISRIKIMESLEPASVQSTEIESGQLQNFQPEKPLILIVEDNEEVLEYLFSVLEGNYQLDLAQNGKEGLEKAISHIPDLILTDVMMPVMDGLELIDLLKKDIRTDHIPIVVLTARGDFNSKIQGLESGVDHYLVKPFNKKELLLKLHNLLESRKKMQLKLGVMQPPSPGQSEYRREARFMNELNTLLEQHLDDENFGVNEICQAFNMSRPNLYRKFKALTNTSIARYLRLYRLHKAKLLIENSEKNVTQAAFATGFKNLSHFSAIFHEEFGFPPSEYLKH